MPVTGRYGERKVVKAGRNAFCLCWSGFEFIRCCKRGKTKIRRERSGRKAVCPLSGTLLLSCTGRGRLGSVLYLFFSVKLIYNGAIMMW
jgi:hypothetical protein